MLQSVPLLVEESPVSHFGPRVAGLSPNPRHVLRQWLEVAYAGRSSIHKCGNETASYDTLSH